MRGGCGILRYMFPSFHIDAPLCLSHKLATHTLSLPCGSCYFIKYFEISNIILFNGTFSPSKIHNSLHFTSLLNFFIFSYTYYNLWNVCLHTQSWSLFCCVGVGKFYAASDRWLSRKSLFTRRELKDRLPISYCCVMSILVYLRIWFLCIYTLFGALYTLFIVLF